MSRKANTTEAENAQTELIDETVSANRPVVDTEAIVKPVESAVNPKTAVTKANKTGKMGVYKFLSLYPQDIYIETLLTWNYPNSFFTKEQWFQKIDELMNMPIYN